MKYTYFTLAALLIAAPCVKAEDTNVEAQEETQKTETITKKARAKHFGVGLVKATACLGQLWCLKNLYGFCDEKFEEAQSHWAGPKKRKASSHLHFWWYYWSKSSLHHVSNRKISLAIIQTSIC